jgi:hypothetical protein
MAPGMPYGAFGRVRHPISFPVMANSQSCSGLYR